MVQQNHLNEEYLRVDKSGWQSLPVEEKIERQRAALTDQYKEEANDAHSKGMVYGSLGGGFVGFVVGAVLVQIVAVETAAICLVAFYTIVPLIIAARSSSR